jgi:type III secretory pathway component EscU
MIEFTLFCLGIIIMVMFIMAMILDYKLKQHEKKEFYKNLNKLNNERKRNT